MRFKLLLQINKNTFGDRISMNYAYELSSLIYRVLSQSDNIFSQWLHDNGFKSGNKRFKLFTFSRLHIPRYRIEKDCIRILSDTIEWYISFLPEISTEKFVQGLFRQQTFEIGNKKSVVQFHVQQIEVVPPPIFAEHMVYEAISPICIPLKREDGGVEYISPEHGKAEKLIRLNLLEKYRAVHRSEFPIKDFPFTLKVLTRPRSSLITIKAGTPEQTRVRGYMFRFELTAPIELQRLLYETGCASKNSIGMGMVKNYSIKV